MKPKPDNAAKQGQPTSSLLAGELVLINMVWQNCP